jgi:hypothetical protein
MSRRDRIGRFTPIAALSLLLITGNATRVGASAPDLGGASNHWVSVIVKLDDEPVATYRGGVPGLAATSREMTRVRRIEPSSTVVRAYRAHLARRFAAIEAQIDAAVPGARVLHRYDVVLGGLAVQVPEDAVAALAGLPGVAAVYPDELQPLETTRSPAFISAPALWGKLGGPENAGEGTIVGVLDTGIWPEHPSFSDPDPKGKPYVMPPGTRPCQFSGGANPGPSFTCNGVTCWPSSTTASR